MPGPYKRKRSKRSTKINSKNYKTKFRTKDEDEIHNDMKQENVQDLLNQEIDVDKPGEGQFYCLHCARYFIDNCTLQYHFKTKDHKKRIKNLEIDPYTVEDSERAAGLGNFKPPSQKSVPFQLIQTTDNDIEIDF